jgi:hypothetical protein
MKFAKFWYAWQRYPSCGPALASSSTSPQSGNSRNSPGNDARMKQQAERYLTTGSAD